METGKLKNEFMGGKYKAGDWFRGRVLKFVDPITGDYEWLDGREKSALRQFNERLFKEPVTSHTKDWLIGGNAIVENLKGKGFAGVDLQKITAEKRRGFESLDFKLSNKWNGGHVQLAMLYHMGDDWVRLGVDVDPPEFISMRVVVRFNTGASTDGADTNEEIAISFPARLAKQGLTVGSTGKTDLFWILDGAEYVLAAETRALSSEFAAFILTMKVPTTATDVTGELTIDHSVIDFTDPDNLTRTVSAFTTPEGDVTISRMFFEIVGGEIAPDNVDQAFDDLSNRAQSGVAIATQLTAITKSFNELSLDIKAQLQSNVGTIGNRIDAVTVILTTWLSTLADDLGTEHHVVYATAAEAPITDDVILTNGPDGKVLIHLRDDAGLIQPLSAYMTTNVNIDFAEAKLTAYAANLRTIATATIVENNGGGSDFDVNKILTYNGEVLTSQGNVLTGELR